MGFGVFTKLLWLNQLNSVMYSREKEVRQGFGFKKIIRCDALNPSQSL